jgi:hypothetical protein
LGKNGEFQTIELQQLRKHQLNDVQRQLKDWRLGEELRAKLKHLEEFNDTIIIGLYDEAFTPEMFELKQGIDRISDSEKLPMDYLKYLLKRKQRELRT